MHNIISILGVYEDRLIMSEKLREKVLMNLRKVYDPEIGRNIVDLNMVKNIVVEDDEGELHTFIADELIEDEEEALKYAEQRLKESA